MVGLVGGGLGLWRAFHSPHIVCTLVQVCGVYKVPAYASDAVGIGAGARRHMGCMMSLSESLCR